MTNERLAVSAADLDDLDLPTLESYLARRAPGLLAASSRDEAATRLGLLAKVAPRLLPTVVGLYVFGKVPQYVFPEWGVGCVTIAGTSLTDPVQHSEDLEGPIIELVERGLAYAASHSGGGSGGPGDEYPRASVREALVNALVHRDLRRPSRVALRLFTDRLEVWSPGGPPEGLGDLEELARDGGVSLPRNPMLAAIARQLGLSEQLGRGLALMHRGPGGAHGSRVELKSSPREVLVTVPSRWQRPRAEQELS